MMIMKKNKMKEHFAIFRFEQNDFLVKYTCSKDHIGRDDIDDFAVSYYNSLTYDKNKPCKDIIHEIMSSFDGVEYEIIDTLDGLLTENAITIKSE